MRVNSSPPPFGNGAKAAVRALRHVVQEHGDAHTTIGQPATLSGVEWFGRLLRWEWPPSYLEVLARHDGVLVQDALVFSFLQSIDTFLIFAERWHRTDGFWPVAGDGCGNYYVLAFPRGSDGECRVLFLDTMADEAEAQREVAGSYAEFVTQHMAAQCRRLGCTGP